MRAFLEQYLRGKKVLIVGFGREGRSTYHVLKDIKSLQALAISDRNPINALPDDAVSVITGESYLDILNDYDVVIKSPGVALPKKPAAYTCCVTSQIALFLRCYARQTIGITGTKGKSTTSSLLYHILTVAGADCILAGNIGVPVFDVIDSVTASTTIVLEMSCHQLEYITVSPTIAVLLNLFEDHLDRYGTFEVYADAKKNIYRYQTADDVLFCNPEHFPASGDCAAQIRGIYPERVPGLEQIKTRLQGAHNRFDITVVYEICKHLNVDEEAILSGIATFEPLKHRLEPIGTVAGVDYYDDSISTTVESTIGAITSIRNIGTVLIGGMERGIDYSRLIDFLLTHHVDNVIFMYDSGKRIYETIRQADPEHRATSGFVYRQTLEEAVRYARKVSKPGQACVLSPAAASYGVFKNFEERGNEFRRLVHAG